MCTVTFIPFEEQVFITSNRDELVARNATPPAVHRFASGKIAFPQDKGAGGTWIAMHHNGNIMVLLNGAFEKHIHQPPYRKSRGIVFLELFDHANPAEAFDLTDLDNIEPFTLVLYHQGFLTEMRWDGSGKYSKQLTAAIPHIWSSATLYEKKIIHKREQWFAEWLQERTTITAEDILLFHEFGGDGDTSNDFKMNRGEWLRTVSITGITLEHSRLAMYHKDLISGKQSVNEWLFANEH